MVDALTIHSYFVEYPESKWLVAAAVFFLIEVLIIPGVGMFFAALAALMLGTLILLGVVATDSFTLEVAIWFGLTVFWAAVLWKPLKNMRSKNTEDNDVYRGTSATVEREPLRRGETGMIRWSGSSSRAMLRAESEHAFLDVGQKCWVWEKQGAYLIVDAAIPPKQNH